MFLNYELFSMNNKTITEFGFRIIWRIMGIEWGVIADNTLRDLHNSLYDTQPHSLIVKCLKKSLLGQYGPADIHFWI